MVTHYVKAKDLRGLDTIEIHNFKQGDTVVIIGVRAVPTNVGSFVIETVEPTKYITPTQKPNRGPQGGVETWKRRGKK